MMDRDAQIRQVELELDFLESKREVEAYEAYETLKETPEWKLLIEEFLLKDEVIRSVKLKADPSFEEPAKQRGLEAAITMYGEFSIFINALKDRASMITTQIESNQTFLTKVRG